MTPYRSYPIRWFPCLFFVNCFLVGQGYTLFHGYVRSRWHCLPPALLSNYPVLYATTPTTRIEGIDYVIDEEINEEDEEEEMDLADTDLLHMAETEKDMLAIARQKIKNVELLSPLDEKTIGTKVYTETLVNEGVCRINHALSPELCTKLATLIMEELKHSIEQVEQEEIDVFDRFSNLLSSNNRWDLKLPLDDPNPTGKLIKSALCELLSKSGVVGPTIKSLFTDRAELFELAAFCTLPGAERQVVHADTLFTKQPVLFVVTVALQDITEDMGPTLFLPGTHTKAMHKKFDGSKTKGELLTKHPHKLSLLSTGDVSIYDSRCLHCGTENQSNKSRILLYATFRNSADVSKGIGQKDQQDDYWNVASIRPEYVGKYTLHDFMS